MWAQTWTASDMEWFVVFCFAAGVVWAASWTARTTPPVLAEVEKAHKAEEAARREALACLQSLIRQREANVCLWEALAEYSAMTADAMGVAEEFGGSEGMAFLAAEMGGERWTRIVKLTDEAKS